MTCKLLASMTKKIMVKLTKMPSNYLKVMSEDQKRDQDQQHKKEWAQLGEEDRVRR